MFMSVSAKTMVPHEGGAEGYAPPCKGWKRINRMFWSLQRHECKRVMLDDHRSGAVPGACKTKSKDMPAPY